MGGHSHAYSLVAAQNAGFGPTSLAGAVAYTRDHKSGSPDGDDYWDYLADKSTGKVVAIVWSGNQHNVDFLVQPHNPFRVWLSPLTESADVEKPWVPQAMIRAKWEPSFFGLTSAIEKLHRSAQVIILGTPPPKTDDFIAKIMASDTYLLGRANESHVDVSTLRITPQNERLIYWTILQSMLRDCATEAGVAFIPSPSASSDAAGFLLPSHCAADTTHANDEHGALLWRALESHVKSGLHV